MGRLSTSARVRRRASVNIGIQELEGRALLSAGVAAAHRHMMAPAEVHRVANRIEHLARRLELIENRHGAGAATHLVHALEHRTERLMGVLPPRVGLSPVATVTVGLEQNQKSPAPGGASGVLSAIGSPPSSQEPTTSSAADTLATEEYTGIPDRSGTDIGTFTPGFNPLPPTGQDFGVFSDPTPTDIPDVTRYQSSVLGTVYVYNPNPGQTYASGLPGEIIGANDTPWLEAHPQATSLPDDAAVAAWTQAQAAAAQAQAAAAQAAANAAYVASLGGVPTLTLTGPTQAYFAITPTRLTATVNPASAGGVTAPAPQIVSYRWDLSQAPDATAQGDPIGGSITGQGTPTLQINWGDVTGVARRLNTIKLTVTLADQTTLTQSFSVEVIGESDPAWGTALTQALFAPDGTPLAALALNAAIGPNTYADANANNR